MKNQLSIFLSLFLMLLFVTGCSVQDTKKDEKVYYMTTLSGRVTNSSGGGAISGASVTAVGAASPVTSNASGYYSISVTHSGTIGLGVTATGYSSYATTISTTASTYTQNVSIVSTTTSYTTTVSGTVTNISGTAISGATVTAVGAASPVTSNASGYYSISVTHSGTIGLGVTATGYSSYATTISTTAGTYTQNVSMVSTTTSYTTTVSGTVTNTSGTAISGASVTAVGAASPVTSNASGYYSISVTHSGTIGLGVSATGYSSYATTISTTASTYTQNVSMVSTTTSYTTTVSGTVTNTSGTAISGATVTAVGAASPVTSNASGYYSISVTHSGTIGLGVTATGYSSYATTISTTASTYTQNVSMVSTTTYYTITFDKNDIDATGSMMTQSIATGSSANLITNTFRKTGWTFAGWATTSTGPVTYMEGAVYTMVSANVTLYAKWTAFFTITFDKNDSAATGTMTLQSIEYGKSVNLTTNAFAKVGWTFLGWATTPSGEVAYSNSANYTMGSANVTLYAKWTIFFSISFDKNDNTATGTMPLQSIEYGKNANLTSNTFRKTGWTFNGWAIIPTGTVVYTDGMNYTMGMANVTLYANWTPPAVYSLRDIGPAGGWIFYDKGSYSDGWRYLEAAPGDQSTGTGIIWGGNYTSIGSTQTGIGKGKSNTNAIVSKLGASSSYAAKLCDDLIITSSTNVYDDWFLPSKDELNQMYVNLHSKKVGGFDNDSNYWSSYEDDDVTAWQQFFMTGYQSWGSKSFHYLVRAARAF